MNNVNMNTVSNGFEIFSTLVGFLITAGIAIYVTRKNAAEIEEIKRTYVKKSEFETMEEHLHEHITALNNELKNHKDEFNRMIEKIFDKLETTQKDIVNHIDNKIDKIDNRFFGLMKSQDGENKR